MLDHHTGEWIKVAIVAASPTLRAGLSTLLDRPNQVKVFAVATSPGELPTPISGYAVLVLAGEQYTTKVELEELQLLDEQTALLFLIERGGDLLSNLTSLKHHIWGILPMDSSADEMLAAIVALNQGLIVGSPHLLGSVLTSEAKIIPLVEREFEQNPVEVLTEREGQVLQLLGQGLANKQIASKLEISEHTVKFHVSAIYHKLGVSSRTEAVRTGVRHGLISL